MTNPTHIKNLLRKSLQKAGIEQEVDASCILEKAEKAVEKVLGDKVKGKIKPLHLRRKVVTFACLSSVIHQEIRLNQAKIIEIINQSIKKEAVKELRCLIY